MNGKGKEYWGNRQSAGNYIYICKKKMLKMRTYQTVKRLLGYISPAKNLHCSFKEILDISNKSPSLECPAEALYSFP